VKAILKRRKVKLEETAGFFLDDLDRIASRNYEPTDDDVVRARLRTLAVQEYTVKLGPPPSQIVSSGLGSFGHEWLIYDVGGSRTMRNAWIPFFDNVSTIIFLAPVSCFDERLSEDSRVNRLEDSFLLWRSICSSKLLADATMVLFLNKCDLLRKKLRAGVQVKKYLPSYGDRSNDPNTVVKYLREKFKEILKQNSPKLRASYFYATSVVDTKATASTIKAVKDSILKDYLKNAELV
jgi:GTPase SAR1 family protein